MKDQAEGLRLLAQNAHQTQGKKRTSNRRPKLNTRAIAITSGKGGVGKTNITINLAIELSRRGQRVLVVDADWGLANVDVILGVTPELNLSHFLSEEAELEEIIYKGPEGILLVPNGSGLIELANLSQVKQRKIFAALAELEDKVDIILLDTGAGISDKVLNFVYSAGEALVVVTPEPTSIRDAYAVIKTIVKKAPKCKLGLLVNMADDPEEGLDVGERITSVVEQFLGRNIELLGSIHYDRALLQSVREQTPVLLSSPKSRSARDIRAIADKILPAGETSADGEDNEGFFTRMSKMFRG